MVQTRAPKEKFDIERLREKEEWQREAVEGSRLLWMVDGGLP